MHNFKICWFKASGAYVSGYQRESRMAPTFHEITVTGTNQTHQHKLGTYIRAPMGTAGSDEVHRAGRWDNTVQTKLKLSVSSKIVQPGTFTMP